MLHRNYAMGLYSLYIDTGVFLLLPLLLLVLPLRWVAGFAFAAIWHEFCHYLVLMFTGTAIDKIRIGIDGIRMDITDLSVGMEFLCAVSGPFGGLLLLTFRRVFPELAICALLQSLYNMLPVYPLDGGRALKCVFHWICPRYADTLCQITELLTVISILFFGIAVDWGIVSICAAFLLLCKLLRGKIPCKLE